MRLGGIGIVALGFALSISAASFESEAAGVKASASTASKSNASTSTAPKNKKPPPPPSQEHIDKGVASYLAQDYPAATAAFQDAVRVDPNRAYPYYMLGSALRAEKKLTEAETAWRNGLQRAAKEPNTRVKLMFVLADILEQQMRWDEAIVAWNEYSAFLEAAPKLKGFPETAVERVKVIERRKEMEVEYGKVKERIEQRERDIAAGQK